MRQKLARGSKAAYNPKPVGETKVKFFWMGVWTFILLWPCLSWLLYDPNVVKQIQLKAGSAAPTTFNPPTSEADKNSRGAY